MQTHALMRFLLAALIIALAACGDEPEPGNIIRPPVDRETVTAPKRSATPANESPLPPELEWVPNHERRAFNQPFRDEFARFDAGTDGWDTEVFQNEATGQLEVLKELLHQPDTLSESLSDVVTADVRVSDLRPALREVFRDEALAAWRAEIKTSPASQGIDAFARAIEEFLSPFQDPEALQIKFKIVTVTPDPSTGIVATRLLYEGSGLIDGKRRQQNAMWQVRWRRFKDGDTPPKITRLDLESLTESASTGEKATLFTDITASVFANEPAWESHLQYGIDHWRHQLERTLAPGLTSNAGLAVGDLNGDGLEDVYLCQALSLPDRVLIHQFDGTVKDMAKVMGLDVLDATASALILDLDNDGDQDLIVAGDGGASVYENQGSLKFQKRTHIPFSSAVDSMCAADYDHDTFLDFYLCGHTPAGGEHSESVLGIPLPIYDAENGQPNKLIRNLGNWEFQDVTTDSGMNVNNSRFSYAAAWEDFDDDGDQDLYVANDFGRNNLYQNNGGTFKDVAGELGAEDISSGMSVSWADFNRDGRMDVYVGNMFSSAGTRVTYQRQFRPGANAEKLGHLRRMARGNSLFENRGQNAFADVSVESGLTMGRWAWASPFVDFNNDGWKDVAVVNGFVTNRVQDDL